MMATATISPTWSLKPGRHVHAVEPVMNVGTAMIAAHDVTSSVMMFIRCLGGRLVYRIGVTRSRSDSFHSVARSTWS